jgi:hypothetical protein
MVWNKIKDVFASPQDRSALQGLRPGKVILTGTVVAGDEELRSPINGYTCVGFFYRANWQAKTRDHEITRVYREAECFAPDFFLQLDDGRLPVAPKRTEPFTHQDHLDLLAADINGLAPAEQLLRAGDRVRLHGRLRQDDDGPWLELLRTDILEARPLERKAGNRKARRKQQRDKRREKGKGTKA